MSGMKNGYEPVQMFESVPARLCCRACLHRRLPQCIAPAFPFFSLVRCLLRSAETAPSHRPLRPASGGVSENCSDDCTAAIGNPQRMGIQNFTGVLKQAIAHTGHAAADDDDFRIVQAENGAQTVAKQFSGFLHGLNGNQHPRHRRHGKACLQ